MNNKWSFSCKAGICNFVALIDLWLIYWLFTCIHLRLNDFIGASMWQNSLFSLSLIILFILFCSWIIYHHIPVSSLKCTHSWRQFVKHFLINFFSCIDLVWFCCSPSTQLSTTCVFFHSISYFILVLICP